jgi:hypothetical protein
VISALVIAITGTGVAYSVIDVADFQAALSALSAADPELAVEAQANSSSDRDFAVGGGQSGQTTGGGGGNFGLSAHSGPSGDDPFGHVSETIPGDGKYRARVTCLTVVADANGMRAGIRAEITESSSNTLPAGTRLLWHVRDTGLSGGTGDGFRRTTTSIQIGPCMPSTNIPVLEHGNINIHDAQP